MTGVSRVGATKFATSTELEVVITRVFDAPGGLVFATFTNPEHLPHWMVGRGGWSMTACENDLRPGGAWRYAWCGARGAEREMRGVYQEVVAPERIVTSASWGDEWPETVHTLVLTERNHRTTATTTVRFPSVQARDAALGSGMKEGMSASFDRLAAYLAALV